MARKNKFEKGAAYTSLDEVWESCQQGRWFYWHDRPIHFGFIQNMSMRTVAGAVRGRRLFQAFRVSGQMVCNQADGCEYAGECEHAHPHPFTKDCELAVCRFRPDALSVRCLTTNSAALVPACIGGD